VILEPTRAEITRDHFSASMVSALNANQGTPGIGAGGKEIG